MSKIKDGDVVYVHYTGKLENGQIFDSSLEREPLEVKIGGGSVIAGFENGLLGMEIGEKKTVEIDSDEAYGQRHDYMLQASSPMGPINFTVIELKEDTVVLDGNHPLAGEKLILDLEIVDVQ